MVATDKGSEAVKVSWRQRANALGRDNREPLPPLAQRPYALAGSCSRLKPEGHIETLSAGMLLVGGLVILIDLLSKSWANGHLTGSRAVGPVTLQIAHNAGISWGVLGAQPALATTASIIGLAVLAFLARITRPAVRVALAIATAGGLSNLIDRLMHGSVTDWIHVAGYAPTFNLADIAVRGGLLVAAVIALWPQSHSFLEDPSAS